VRCPRELAAQCRVAWIGAVSPSLLLLTDAGAAQPPITRHQTPGPRPTRQSALAGVEQALSQVALLPARESERVVAPLELTLVGRPTEQQGPRPRRRLPSPESSRLVSRRWVLVACSSEAGVISCRAGRGCSTRSTSEHGSRGKCPVLSTFRSGPNASRRAKSLGPGNR